MKQAIVICTHENRKQWLHNLMDTLYGVNYPIAIHENTRKRDGFEIAAIKHAIDEEIDEFVLLQDSIEIKDKSLFDIVFGMVEISIYLQLSLIFWLLSGQIQAGSA